MPELNQIIRKQLLDHFDRDWISYDRNEMYQWLDEVRREYDSINLQESLHSESSEGTIEGKESKISK